jgi:hypothetical protein
MPITWLVIINSIERVSIHVEYGFHGKYFRRTMGFRVKNMDSTEKKKSFTSTFI